MVDEAYLENLAKSIEKNVIRYVDLAGIKPEIVEERHIRVSMPLGDLHKNHVGTAYAGSTFILGEIAGGALFMATYGTDKFVPIIKAVTTKYLKPGVKDLVVDISISEEEAAEKLKPIEERGRGDYFLDVPICDVDGEQIALMEVNYYAIPTPKA